MVEKIQKDGYTVIRRTAFRPNNRAEVEKVFGVTLKGRGWSITSTEQGEIELTYYDKGGEDEGITASFGWCERLSAAEFINRLYDNNLWLRLK